jgi:hypothetical protein
LELLQVHSSRQCCCKKLKGLQQQQQQQQQMGLARLLLLMPVSSSSNSSKSISLKIQTCCLAFQSSLSIGSSSKASCALQMGRSTASNQASASTTS